MTERTISEAWSVNDTLRRYPESIAVFNHLGVDSCCGGGASLADAARKAGIEPAEMMRVLNASIESGEFRLLTAITPRRGGR
jgi:regulator of cell morphogenesis and NO signaling